MRQLVEAAASVAGQADLADVLRTTVRTAMDLTNATHGALGVLGSHGMLTDFIFEGVDRHTAKMIGAPPIGRGVLGAIGSRPVRLDDVSTHPHAAGFPAHHPALRAFLGVPVRLGHDTLGNLYLAHSGNGAFTAEDETLVEGLAVIAGSAISRARLERRLERAALVEDRERIARDIHDGVIQELFAVGLALQTARGADATTADHQITQAMLSIDDAMTRLREYIFDLQSPVPDFEARLRTIVHNVAGDTRVKVLVEGDFSTLERTTSEGLIQFVREGVSNAVRHARADTITVRATADSATVMVEVADDGVGFDPGGDADGLGLANMRERMSTLGGLCVVESTPGRGTVARGSVPVD